MKKNYSVIIPNNLHSLPSKREISAAWILAGYFQKNVEFVNRGISKSADYLIDKKFWELKSLEGNGKRTVQHALHKAARQSKNVVIDARDTKMNIRRVRSQVQHHFKYIPKIKQLLLIEKDGKVLEILK